MIRDIFNALNNVIKQIIYLNWHALGTTISDSKAILIPFIFCHVTQQFFIKKKTFYVQNDSLKIRSLS